jgi:hypothetical protein
MKSKKEIIGLVLMAVAELEDWDDRHPSIRWAGDGEGWAFEHGLPVPSNKLLTRIRELEKRAKA